MESYIIEPLPPRSITSRETSCIYYKSKVLEELHVDTCDGNSVSLNLFLNVDLGIIVEAGVDAYSNQTKLTSKSNFNHNRYGEIFTFRHLPVMVG